MIAQKEAPQKSVISSSHLIEAVKNSANPAIARIAKGIEKRDQAGTQAYSRMHHRHNRS